MKKNFKNIQQPLTTEAINMMSITQEKKLENVINVITWT